MSESFTPDLGGRVHMQAEVPVKSFHHKLAALEVALEDVILRFEEDAIRAQGTSRDDRVQVAITEPAVSYNSYVNDVAVGVNPTRLRDAALFPEPDPESSMGMGETLTIGFESDESEASVSSGTYLNHCPLIDPAEVHVGEELLTLDWEATVSFNTTQLKAALGEIFDPTLERVALRVTDDGLGIHGRVLGESTDNPRHAVIEAEITGDTGYTFLNPYDAAEIINSLPTDEVVTIKLGQSLPPKIEVAGITYIVAPNPPINDEQIIETIDNQYDRGEL